MAEPSMPEKKHEEQSQSTPLSDEMTAHFAAGTASAVAGPRLSSRFAIERLHAQGGLGRVSLANDGQLKRSVAVKEIRPDRRNAEARLRFVNEAEITGQLEHPGIVPIYALEQDASGEPYYVMRFIQGRPLSDAVRDYHCQPTHFDFRELLQRFTSVCQTVAYAHSRGVVHRDLKPANIMLGEFGETLVVDWGLAKRLSSANGPGSSGESRSAAGAVGGHESTVASPGEASTILARKPSAGASDDPTPRTEMGQIMGTPAYMAPEQAAGRWDQVGPASDIYSLGAMLYVLLTGQTPVQDANAREIVRRVQQGAIQTPRQVRAGVPRPLEAICLKALAFEPAMRYAGAQELSDDIEHWLADEPVSAYAEPWGARAGRWLRKHRLLVGSAAVLLVSALVATTIGLVAVEAERARTETARSYTAAALTRVTAEEKKSQAALANEMKARQRTHAALNTLTDQMLKRLLTRQTQIGPDERAYLRQVQAFYQEFADDNGSSEAARYISADGHLRVAGVRAALGELREAEEDYRDAIALYAPLAADYPQEMRHRSSLAGAHLNLGFLLGSLARLDEAESEYRRAIKLFNEVTAAEPQESRHRQALAATYINLGIVLGAQKKQPEEEAEYVRALQIQEKLVADEPDVPRYRSELAMTQQNLGLIKKRRGQFADAIQAYERAIDLCRQLVADSPDDPEYRYRLATTQSRLAGLFREQGRRAEAEVLFREAVTVLEELAADFPIVRDYRTELAGNYTNFGGVVRENGHAEASLALYTKGIALLEPILEHQPNLMAERVYLRNVYWGRALSLDQLYRREDALRDWDRAVELSSEAEKPQIQMPRAASLAGAGRHQEAVEQASRLVEGASAGVTYDAACVHALAAAAVKDDALLHEQYAVRAIELLQRAKADGLFRNRAMVAYIRTDNDLKPLRDREDFRNLLAELERPEPTK